ncbi:hypothetical protein A5768_26190 [Mycolicibacterium fortuitum]|uniref:hypothetical protein n=1 Tax=Mycolicibacterium fortuitum TaxID=1766 RepID=UPI0007EA27F6|nr:hypothetical protein [Mycolicibacterium fortuitum]OBG21594.1 hypothetical protein A5768_26190 [Mycolicibacterium fortuitum]
MKWRDIAVLAVVGLVASACGHSDEWQYGYDHRGDARSQMGMGISAESACRAVAGYGYGRTNGVINSQDAYDGCMAGLRD